ncbi:MAG: hypothetical protein AVDCRST_MAG57-1512 [uncultured Blastococcus sp.]|uniref:CopC domain-containing protein n=1 Tax=uncultured Blastococcus sp. TaxID=217144 RepID=A0A6J4I4A1_9ACTN|nr:MAG: hypothetical protein AVDCRST_MAG57-1512 [uncultured Blastococcus sp.]
MPVTGAPRRRLVLLLAVVWSAVLIGGAGTASAHESLTASEPADGGVLVTAPQQLTLQFSAPPDVDEVGVVLRTVTGAEVVTGQPAADGTALIVGLLEPLPNGVYTMEWSGAFDDGHPVGGTVSFTVEAASGPGPAPEASADTATEVDEASSEDDGMPVLPWFLAGVVVAAAAGAFLLRRGRAG